MQNSITNVRNMRKKFENTGEKQNNDEPMSLFTLQQNCDCSETVYMSNPAYYAFLYQPKRINNIVHFWCTDFSH